MKSYSGYSVSHIIQTDATNRPAFTAHIVCFVPLSLSLTRISYLNQETRADITRAEINCPITNSAKSSVLITNLSLRANLDHIWCSELVEADRKWFYTPEVAQVDSEYALCL